jgi:flagellar biosynthesis chaperone FliJ
MRPFRFRAAAALDLRRKEEEAARLRLARAQSDLQNAVARAAAAVGTATDALAGLAAAHASGTEAWRLVWHECWLRRQRLEADACRRTVAVSATIADHAAASVSIAHQKRRVLERLRERAWHRHQQAADRQATNEMNLLANLRYLAQAGSSGGSDSDDRPNPDHREPDDHT